LLQAGRADDAVAQAERAVETFPDRVDVRARAAKVFQEARRHARAEDLCRSVLEADLEDEDVLHYRDAIETLTEVLRATAGEGEVPAREASEPAERLRAFEQDDGGNPRAPALTGPAGDLPDQGPVAVRRQAPRPGRNDPCPCGSGKRYRACHGT